MSDKVGVIALILAIVVAILVAVIYFIYFAHQGSIQIHSTSYVIQKGNDAASDTMVTGSNNCYIGYSTQPLVLTISPNSDNKKGRIIMIKNNSSNNQINLAAGSGVTIDNGNITPTTIYPGQTVQFIATDNNNSWLRLTSFRDQPVK